MCNSCNIARRTYNRGINAPWEEYQRNIDRLLRLYGSYNHPYYFNDLEPHKKKYTEAARLLSIPYSEAVINCKDIIKVT